MITFYETEGYLLILRVRTESGRLEEVLVEATELETALAAAEESITLIPADGLFLLIEAATTNG